MFKKISALLVCVLMLCGAMPMAVTAADSVTYTVQTFVKESAVKQGEEFTVAVSISNVDALACIECKLRYDKTLMTAVSATEEGFLRDCIMKGSNIVPLAPETSDPNKYGEIWITGLADGDHAASGVLTTITFKALKDITADTEIVIFKTPIAAQADMTEYVCLTENGGVMITGSTPTPVIPDNNEDTVTTTAAGDTVPTTAGGTVTTTTVGDTQTTQTTEKQHSIGAPEGVMTPIETTTAATTQNGDAKDGDNTIIIVVIAVAAAAIVTAVAVIVLRKKKL